MSQSLLLALLLSLPLGVAGAQRTGLPPDEPRPESETAPESGLVVDGSTQGESGVARDDLEVEVRLVDAAHRVLESVRTRTDAAGEWLLPIPVQKDPSMCGLSMVVQGAVVGPFGPLPFGALTDAILVFLGD